MNKNINKFLVKLNALSSVSVDSILDIGLLFLDAKKELSSNEYQEFLKQTKYVNKSSSVRKWEVIGKANTRLKSLKSKLPSSWTTIYKIASLSSLELDLLDNADILNPSVTSREIDEELNPRTPSSKATNELIAQIIFKENADPDEILTALDNIAEMWHEELEIQKSKELTAHLRNFRQVA